MKHPDVIPPLRGLAADISWTFQEHQAEQWSEWRSWLSDEEAALLETFGSEKRRIEFVLGRTAARRLIGERTGTRPQDVVLHVADDGAVEIVDVPLHLSISHANGWATAAVSPRAMGMDMERLTMRSPGVYRYFLSKKEYTFLEGTELDHDQLQILLWTLKEGVLKGLRTGLRISPKDLEIIEIDYSGTARLKDGSGAFWQLSWVFWRGCYLAIADRENLL